MTRFRSSTASTARRTCTPLSEEELVQVADEVRAHIIATVGEIGGHFGANLGTCELAVALHSLLDSPRDKILWDVGHQAYPHKILTGRRDALSTIRQYGGLAPFCSIPESEHDIMGAGHASTSIGYAVGLKEGMKRMGAPDSGKVVAVIGDGVDDRRRRLRGAAPGRRRRDADRRRPQRQRHVDRAERRRAVALLHPRPAEPEALAHARDRRGAAERAARRRPAFRALRPAAEGVDQGVLGPRPALGGARLGLHGRHRRPRRPRPARRAAQRLRGPAPGRRPHRDGQGQGLRTRRGRRPGGPGALARGQAEVDPRRRRDPDRAHRPRRARPPAAVHRRLRQRARRRVPPRRARRRHHRGDEHRHRPGHPPEGDARALLRRRHRRAAGDPLRRRPRARGRQAGRGDLLDVPAARLRPDRPRRLPAAPERRLRAGSRGPRRRRRPDAPRRLRHRLPAPAAEHRPDGAARRGDARPHAAHRAASTTTARSRCATRAARRAASRCPPARRRSRSGPARSCARATAGSRSSATAAASRRRWRPRSCSPRAASTSRSPTRASPSRSTPRSWRSSPPSTSCS